MTNSNISVLSVGKIVQELSSLYIGALKHGIPFQAIPSAFLWGPPGVGKSDAIDQIAQQIHNQTGKNVLVTDVRLLLFSPIDLRGIPMADASRQFTEWLRPKLFDLDTSEDAVNILFLDELSAAPQSVQAAAYQITLNRTVGEHRLPANTIVIAAGNRVTDRSVAFRMPNALANRMMHFEIKMDFHSWRTWASQNGVNPMVMGYLNYDSSKLYLSEIGSDDVAFPTPRSWMFVSELMNAMPETDAESLYHLISGCIGSGTAMEFVSWCKVYREIVPVKDIFAGIASEYPKKPDQLYSLISSMSAYVAENHKQITVAELTNCCNYASRFPKDFVASLYLNLCKLDDVKLQLFRIPVFKTWLQKNQDVFGSDFAFQGGK